MPTRPPRQGLTPLAKLIHAKQVSTAQEMVTISSYLTKPAEGCFVVEYILSIKLAKKRFGGIAKGAVNTGRKSMQFTSIWDFMTTNKKEVTNMSIMIIITLYEHKAP